MKTFHGVGTAVWPDGKVEPSLLPPKQAEMMPLPETRKIGDRYQYNIDWFNTKSEAIAWIARQNERNKK